MRFLTVLCFCFFIVACGDNTQSSDFASISDPNVEFCKKVKPITIFGKSSCSYCQQSIDAVKARGFEYRYVELSTPGRPKGAVELIAANDELKKKLDEKGVTADKRKTVPQIFFGENYVGGYDDLNKKLLQPIDKLLGAPNVAQAVTGCRK